MKLEVGKRYRLGVWSASAWTEALFVGEVWWIGWTDESNEVVQRVNDDWQPFVEPVEWLEGGTLVVNRDRSWTFGVEDVAKFPVGHWQKIYVPIDRYPEVSDAIERIGR